MKERPIIFSAPMVRALLAGTKAQTRRVVKPQPAPSRQGDGGTVWIQKDGGLHVPYGTVGHLTVREKQGLRCPYGQPGDRLWVRETHWWFVDEPDHSCGYFPPALTIEDVKYRADGDDGRKVWRPSIHMPRWASRITLEIVSVRVERLNEISEADAAAEGLTFSAKARRSAGCMGIYECQMPDGKTHFNDNACDLYRALWEQISGPGSWDASPWVWVVEFKPATAEGESK